MLGSTEYTDRKQNPADQEVVMTILGCGFPHFVYMKVNWCLRYGIAGKLCLQCQQPVWEPVQVQAVPLTVQLSTVA